MRQGATEIWISVTISTILSTCEESKTDKIIGLIYVWTMMPRVNNFHYQWSKNEKLYLQKWKISIKKNFGVDLQETKWAWTCFEEPRSSRVTYATYYQHIRGIECKKTTLRKGTFADRSWCFGWIRLWWHFCKLFFHLNAFDWLFFTWALIGMN